METEKVFPDDAPVEGQFKRQDGDGDGIVPTLRQRASLEQFQSWIRDIGLCFGCIIQKQ